MDWYSMLCIFQTNLKHDWSIKYKSLVWYQCLVVYLVDHIFHLYVLS